MKEQITAQLKVNNLPSMHGVHKRVLVTWLRSLASQINKEKDMKIYAKNFKATLYK